SASAAATSAGWSATTRSRARSSRSRSTAAWRASPGAATATASACASGAPRAWPSSAPPPPRSSRSTTRARSSRPSRPADPMDLAGAAFEKVDMRVGVVIAAKDFPEARRPAYRLWIDFGPLGIKRSSAQITTYYRLDELIGLRVIAVVNFPPRQIGPFVSEVLVLGAYDEAGAVVLLRPDRQVAPGARIG